MVCTGPVKGFRGPGGQIFSSAKQGWSDLPTTRPCGGCVNCRLEYSRQWAMRIMHESSLYKDNTFLTLTYSNEELPENNSLYPKHHELFMKRLRKYVTKYHRQVLRFYHVGEYGDTTKRPHYHDIIFNFDFPDKKYLKTTETGNKLYTSAILDEIWSHGNCIIGDVTFESAAYCARYVMKKLTGARKSEYGLRVPEYSTQSRGGRGGLGGIGSPWLAKWKTDVYPADFCIMNGRKIKVPKRYDQLMIVKETKLGEWVTDSTGFPIWMPSIRRTKMERLKSKRRQSALKHSENQTPERLAVIQELAERRLDQLVRKL